MCKKILDSISLLFVGLFVGLLFYTSIKLGYYYMEYNKYKCINCMEQIVLSKQHK